MKVKLLLIVFVLLLPLQLYSQDTIQPIKILKKNWSKGSLSISTSFSHDDYYRKRYTYSELVRNSKNSTEFINFQKSDYNVFDVYNSRSALYHIGLSFFPYSNKLKRYNENQELKFGLVYHKEQDHSIHFSNKFNPSLYYYGPLPDTSYISLVSYSQLVDEIGLETEYILRSGQFLRRFSFFGGIGGGLNLSVFSQVKEDITIYTSRVICDNSSPTPYCYNVINNETISNYYSNYMAYSIKAFIPYGLNFRVVNKLSIYLEGRSGFSFQKFIYGKGKTRTHQAIGIGVRFNW
jgi:hypothetical protein